jgi:hypothetical protein
LAAQRGGYTENVSGGSWTMGTFLQRAAGLVLTSLLLTATASAGEQQAEIWLP